MLNILFTRHHSQVIMPKRGSAGAACFDLYAYSMKFEDRGYTVHTGLSIALPVNHAMLIYPRSGLSTRYGLTLLNNVGVIDEDYRGEIMIKFNMGLVQYQDEIKQLLQYGNRVAQAMIIEVPQSRWVEVDVLPKTVRGEGGFGSTGVDR